MVIAGDGADTWVKSQTNKIKVTVDAALFSEQQVYGIRMVAIDHICELVYARTQYGQNMVNP